MNFLSGTEIISFACLRGRQSDIVNSAYVRVYSSLGYVENVSGLCGERRYVLTKDIDGIRRMKLQRA